MGPQPTDGSDAPPGLYNWRDLGGLSVEGGHLRSGLLFRSSAVSLLTPADVSYISMLGIRTAIDLREPGERVLEPSELGELAVTHRPIIGEGARFPGNLKDFTAWLITDRGSEVAAAVSTIVEAALPAVFFCSAGKDRTGVVTAVLLAALGATDEVIAADYAISGAKMPPRHRQRAQRQAEAAGFATWLVDDADSSPPEVIRSTLELLRARHGSAGAFLEEHGVPAVGLQRLRAAAVVTRDV